MGPAQAHYWAGAFAVQQGDLSLAQAHFEVCAAAYQGADEQASFGWLFLQRGLLARRHGQATDAQIHFTRACATLRETGRPARCLPMR